MIRWLIAVALVTGCESPKDSAQKTFSTENTCPANRVEAHERGDLKPSSFAETVSAAEPPADVAADPERLKMWRDKHKKPEEPRSDFTGAKHVVEVRGCGKHVFYVCELPQQCAGCKTRFSCDEERHVPATVSSTL